MTMINMFRVCRNKCLYCDRWVARRNAALSLSLLLLIFIMIDIKNSLSQINEEHNILETITSKWMYSKKQSMENITTNLLSTKISLSARNITDISYNDNLQHLNKGNDTKLNVKGPLTVKLEKLKNKNVFSNPAYVVIVTYMRSGSTFLGQLFNKNPKAFYWFEPMDGVYQSLYGMKSGHSIAMDIMISPNGSFRSIPKYEEDAVKQTAINILQCNFKKVPTELLVSPFIHTFSSFQKKIFKYNRCLVETVPKYHIRPCQRFLAMVCPVQLGISSEKQEQCFQNLNPETNVDSDGFYKLPPDFDNKDIRKFVKHTLETLDQDEKSFSFDADSIMLTEDREEHRELRRAWTKMKGQNSEGYINLYKVCQNHYRKAALSCMDHLITACKQAEIRSFKTIRIKLSTVVDILEEMPSAKILYNVRSPIAIASSRKRSGWPTAMSLYSNKTLVKEAEIACKIMKRDLETYNILSKRSQNSVKLHSYEQLSNNTPEMTDILYKFINKTPPYSLGGWVKRNSKHSRDIASNWQQNVTVKEFLDYKDVCDLSNYKYDVMSQWLDFSL